MLRDRFGIYPILVEEDNPIFLRNEFRVPQISREQKPIVAVKDNKLKKKKQDNRLFVPGLRKTPPHPKLSTLTKDEQQRCIKVLSKDEINLNIFPKIFVGEPSDSDYEFFEEKKDVYVAEQEEYIEWASEIWYTKNYRRALRPHFLVKSLYRREYLMKRHMMQCLPDTCMQLKKNIQLLSGHRSCEIVYPERDLVQVYISTLPQCFYPEIHEIRASICEPYSMPVPCRQHPCRVKLPNENAQSELPLTKVHSKLAHYSIENGAEHIASESAIKCILEVDRCWALPVSVCEVISADGVKRNVVVLGSEFPVKEDTEPEMSYRAYKHMLLKTFTKKEFANEHHDSSDDSRISVSSPSIPPRRVPKPKRVKKLVWKTIKRPGKADKNYSNWCYAKDSGRWFKRKHREVSYQLNPISSDYSSGDSADEASEDSIENAVYDSDEEEMKSMFEDTSFEEAPQRSFKKLLVKNNTTKDQFNIIIHCSHKLRNDSYTEVILEPIIEYQLDIGGTGQTQNKIQSLEFSLMLRKKAEVINVRVDATNGELVTIDIKMTVEDLRKKHGSFASATANAIYTTLKKLARRKPGDYILRHEPKNGNEATLFLRGKAEQAAKSKGAVLESLELVNRNLIPTGSSLKPAMPLLVPVLLPCHKYRRQLPLAFTYQHQDEAKFQRDCNELAESFKRLSLE